MNYYSEIWKMQGELNCLIGRDTIKDSNSSYWLYDYTQAFEDEVVETKNCISWKWWSKEGKLNQYGSFIDEKNVNIELIDCLHFIVTISQICNLNPDDFGDIINDKYKDNQKRISDYINTKCPNILFYICELMIRDVVDIKDCTGWRSVGFSDKIPVNASLKDVQNLTLNMWDHLVQAFLIMNMSLDEIYNIYKMKHEKNIKRQENGYSIATKTEDDNNEIKSKI